MRRPDDCSIEVNMTREEYAALELARAIVGASSVPNVVRLLIGTELVEAGLCTADMFAERELGRGRGSIYTRAARALRGEA